MYTCKYLSKRVAWGYETYWSNYTLEGEEVLDLGAVRQLSGREAAAEQYLGVRDAQKWQLEKEVEKKANHS